MTSLSIKYRPEKYSDVLSQDYIVKILDKQAELKQFKSCYIFSGPSGTGKTTIARILALKINEYVDDNGNICSADPIEIDAASNNGVDNVRLIIEGANKRSLDGKYKVYIIDEAHMLTTQSWNALLKTIEETPEFTIFIFCTTEYQKIPETIRNRCQQYFLSRVSEGSIKNRLKYICDKEYFKYTEEGLSYITKLSKGSMRQAIAYLELCSDYSKDIVIENILSVLGDFSYDTYFTLINAIIDKDNEKIINTIESLFNKGQDLKLFNEMFIDFVLDISKYTIFKSFDIIQIPESYKDKLLYTINIDGGTKYFNHVLDKLLEIKQLLKGDSNIKSTLEISLINI